MIEIFHPHDVAINTVLQAMHSLHTQYMTELRCLRSEAATVIIANGSNSCVEEMGTRFQAICEIMRLECDIDAKYNRTLQLCKNRTDRAFLYIFTTERRSERMRLLRQIMENHASQIACNNQLAVEMRICVDRLRSTRFPEYEFESHGYDVSAMEENFDASIAASFNKRVALDFVHLFADMMNRGR